MQKLKGYQQEIEEQMRNLYQSLSEKDHRRYAAIEAKKLGYGGSSYICRLFGCDPSSVKRGQEELETPLANKTKRIRKAGGGRKRIIGSKNEPDSEIDLAFLEIMTPHTAGSPMDESIKWSNLSREKIAQALATKGFVERNPVMSIEHRLFPHVTRAYQGVVFKTIEIVQEFMSKASTKTGLTVFASILDKIFETKRKVEDNFKQTMTICFDTLLPQWNYVAIPNPSQLIGLI